MIKNLLRIFILLLICACNPIKHASNNGSSIVKIQIYETYKMDEPILFEVENIYNQSILIYNPERLWIERFNGDKWQKLKIPECLCDAPCQASVDVFVLGQGNQIRQVWDQQESWCGSRIKGQQIRETIFKSVDKGRYRILIRFKPIDGEETLSIKEFQIID